MISPKSHYWKCNAWLKPIILSFELGIALQLALWYIYLHRILSICNSSFLTLLPWITFALLLSCSREELPEILFVNWSERNKIVRRSEIYFLKMMLHFFGKDVVLATKHLQLLPPRLYLQTENMKLGKERGLQAEGRSRGNVGLSKYKWRQSLRGDYTKYLGV